MLEKKYALFCGPTTLRVWNVISRSSLVWKLQETFSKFCVLQLKRRLARLKSLLRWKVYCAADISTGWPSPSYCYCYSLNKLARKSVIRMRTLQLLSNCYQNQNTPRASNCLSCCWVDFWMPSLTWTQPSEAERMRKGACWGYWVMWNIKFVALANFIEIFWLMALWLDWCFDTCDQCWHMRNPHW